MRRDEFLTIVAGGTAGCAVRRSSARSVPPADISAYADYVRRVTLAGVSCGALRDVAVDDQQRLYVITKTAPSIQVFSPEGRALPSTAERLEATRYNMPYRVVFSAAGDLLVLDLKRSHVFRVNPRSGAAEGVAFNGLGVVGIAVAGDQDGRLYVGGFHPSAEKETNLIYRFDASGRYDGSFCPRHARVRTHHLTRFGGVELAIAAGRAVLASQQVCADIVEYDASGGVRNRTTGTPGYYREPVRYPEKLPLAKEKQAALFARLGREWTPCLGVYRVGEDRVLQAFRDASGKRHIVDILSRELTRTMPGAAIKERPVCVTRDGTLYGLVEAERGDAPAELIVRQIRMEPQGKGART